MSQDMWINTVRAEVQEAPEYRSLYEQVVNLLWGVGAYASLSSSVARDDPAWAKFESDLRTRMAGIGAKSLYLTLELNALDDGQIAAALMANAAALLSTPPVIEKVDLLAAKLPG